MNNNKSSTENDKAIITSDELYSKLKDHQSNLTLNKGYIKEASKIGFKTIEKVDTVLKKHIINVDLEIPSDFVNKLGKGKCYRTGGVVRETGSEKIRKHLREVKPSNAKKLSKIASTGFLVLDIIESAIVDQKLKDILEHVKEIEMKIDAQNRGAFKSAISQLKDISRTKNPENKNRKILLIQNELSKCENIFTEIYMSHWQDYGIERKKFNKSKITNNAELKKMTELAKKIPNELDIIVSCKIAQIKLYEEQEEYSLAKEKSFELNYFIAGQLDKYKNEFNTDNLIQTINKFKNYGFQERIQRIKKIEEQLIEPHEKIEFLFNSSIYYTLTIPEKIIKENEVTKEE